MYSHECLGRSEIFCCFPKFKEKEKYLADEQRVGRIVSASANSNVEKARAIVAHDRRIITRRLSIELGVDKRTARIILEKKNERKKNVFPFYGAMQSLFVRISGENIFSKTIGFCCMKMFPRVSQSFFFLFPKIKCALKVERFDDIQVIQHAVTNRLKGLLINSFHRTYITMINVSVVPSSL